MLKCPWAIHWTPSSSFWLSINKHMNVVYVWVAGLLPEQPSLKALSVLRSRCMLRPPVCLPGWPTLAPTICALLNTFCHCHTAWHVYRWSLSDSQFIFYFSACISGILLILSCCSTEKISKYFISSLFDFFSYLGLLVMWTAYAWGCIITF